MKGGIIVDIESVKNKDTLQLQQIIIFLKAEVAKYKNEISTLKNMDDHAMVHILEQENEQLLVEKKERSLELIQARKSFEKELHALHENIQLRENQRLKLITSIQALVKKKSSLQQENKKLKQMLHDLQTKRKAFINEAPPPVLNDAFPILEKLGPTLHDFIQKNERQWAAFFEELQHNAKETRELLIKLFNENENKLNPLPPMNRTKEQQTPIAPYEAAPHFDTQSYLEEKMQKLFIQTIEFQAQLDEKLRILDEWDDQLIELGKRKTDAK